MNTPPKLPAKLPNRFAVNLEYIKRLSWKQRFQILLGYNAKLYIKLLVDKRTGEVWEAVELQTTQDEAPKTPAQQLGEGK